MEQIMKLNLIDALTGFHCICCDKLLTELELFMDCEFKGMCEECYMESMEAAYADNLNDY